MKSYFYFYEDDFFQCLVCGVIEPAYISTVTFSVNIWVLNINTAVRMKSLCVFVARLHYVASSVKPPSI